MCRVRNVNLSFVNVWYYIITSYVYNTINILINIAIFIEWKYHEMTKLRNDVRLFMFTVGRGCGQGGQQLPASVSGQVAVHSAELSVLLVSTETGGEGRG